MDFLIVTGLSGAGKSQAMNALEDMGYFCVDNLPPQLLEKLLVLHKDAEGYASKMALAIDTRSKNDFNNLIFELEKLDKINEQYQILFIDADDQTIFNRFKENRRKHPLSQKNHNTLDDAIKRERAILESVREKAHIYIETSHLTSAQLKQQISGIFSKDNTGYMMVRVTSFGFKRGLPKDSDMVFDVRCLPNPYYIDVLKNKTGLETDVREYVMQFKESQEYLKMIIKMIDYIHPLFLKEGKSDLIISIGCTGGKHRSVAFAHAISNFLRNKNISVIETHRDKDKPGY